MERAGYLRRKKPLSQRPSSLSPHHGPSLRPVCLGPLTPGGCGSDGLSGRSLSHGGDDAGRGMPALLRERLGPQTRNRKERPRFIAPSALISLSHAAKLHAPRRQKFAHLRALQQSFVCLTGLLRPGRLELGGGWRKLRMARVERFELIFMPRQNVRCGCRFQPADDPILQPVFALPRPPEAVSARMRPRASR